MRVGPTGATSRATSVRAGRGGTSTTASFTAERATTPEPAAPLLQSSAVAAVDALLALQGVSEAQTGRAKALKRAESMLDLLDQIRIGLLEGAIPQSLVSQLVRLVQTRREAFAEPSLQAILEEIELRAQVELAKLGASF